MKVVCMKLFSDFKCTGSYCRHNCCKAGWDIEIDEKTLRRLEHMGDASLEAATVREPDGVYIKPVNGRCPLLNEQGLCSLQLKYGEDYISDICREHPRYYQWFGDYKEAGVGLCCEETVRLLLESSEPLGFFQYETDEEPDDLPFDEEVLAALVEARNGLLRMLVDRSLTIEERLKRLLYHGQRFQDALDDEDVGNIWQEISHLDARCEMTQELCTQHDPDVIAAEIYDYFSSLEMLDDKLPQMLRFSLAKGNIRGTVETFDRLHPDKGYITEHLAVCFLFRYFLQAVRSFEIMEKIKLTVLSTLVMRIMIAAECAPVEDIIREYSAEIEYSAENLEKLADDFYSETCFSYDGLLSLIG